MDLHELHHLIAGKPGFSAVSSPAPFLAQHHSFIPAPGPEQYGLLMVGSSGGEVDLPPPPPPPPPPPHPGMESFGFYETAFGGGGGGGGGQGRWPRQETLTLLEVRSQLDSKFREAAHKGPLWDEVSRIMAEEHGYQRSGKKCREKLENLYKYYKKTKEGKAGRQDGKHYRFFRQLEALYGGSSNATTEINQPCYKATNPSALPSNREVFPASKLTTNLSLSNSSECSESSSSEDEEEDGSTQRLNTGRKRWKLKVEEFIDAQIKRFIEVQETWMNQMLKTLEHMEQARVSREEDWRRQEAARFDQEYSLWAGERAWIEARDAAIIQTLDKISRRRDELMPRRQEDSPSPDIGGSAINIGNAADVNSMTQRWLESETASLLKIRKSLESKFREGGSAKGDLWEEVSAAMACLGCDRSAKRCKEKWDNINRCLRRAKECSKRRRKSGLVNKHLEGSCSEPSGCHEEEDGEQQGSDAVGLGLTDPPPPPLPSGAAEYDAGVDGVTESSSFLFSVGEEESLWAESNGVRHGGGDAS